MLDLYIQDRDPGTAPPTEALQQSAAAPKHLMEACVKTKMVYTS